MITHVVFVKLKDPSTKNIQSAQALMNSLNGKYPGCRYFEVGTDISRVPEHSYDLAMIVKFDDSTRMKAYQKDPKYVPSATKLRELAANILIVDYESSK